MTPTPSTNRLTHVAQELWALRQVARTGALTPMPVRHLGTMAQRMRDYGPIGAAVSTAAIRHRSSAALVDERGVLSFADLDARSNALANAWLHRGLRGGDGVAILARNHRGFLDALFAAAKCGARIILLNTDFGPDQIRDVLRREGADMLVHDAEYGASAPADLRLGCVVAWADSAVADSVESLIERSDPGPPVAPRQHAKLVILTSGTTGTPKGASRSQPRSLLPAGGLLSKVPFRARESTECCVPLFHALGFGHVMLALLLGSTMIVRRRFDPQLTLRSLAEHKVTALIAVPVMVRRLIDARSQTLVTRDLSALRIVFVAGSPLGAALCRQALDVFGPVIYNMYGSTEVAYATIATPADLAAEPGCVGRPVPGTVVKLFDDSGGESPPGTTGRIFVGNAIPFDGYTGGGGKEIIDGLLCSGDVGHFDAAGRLFIDGRDDDMIVSGAENVFPAEVEETLASHPAIREVAVIGVPDDEYGQRLRSFVVLRPGATLTDTEVREHVRHRLARFKVPRDVVFVDALPRNATGKVLKRALDTGMG
ncbi:AMP-binding protein [Mycobacterium sp. IDR2000157661]|uniref:AMP-binding protein n=1 Tax=Mycobacterium sp. IDR2000157661 TaxID=2867005 RepID=UPI001EEA09F3|nr:AMP-binding protein [Mycobacterium sp. IDR2000157661]ULE33700.1 AMP-binding protein [Mycobacterium sp. IDR2000157661]